MLWLSSNEKKSSFTSQSTTNQYIYHFDVKRNALPTHPVQEIFAMKNFLYGLRKRPIYQPINVIRQKQQKLFEYEMKR